jgi:hypothetical protein
MAPDLKGTGAYPVNLRQPYPSVQTRTIAVTRPIRLHTAQSGGVLSTRGKNSSATGKSRDASMRGLRPGSALNTVFFSLLAISRLLGAGPRYYG